MRIVSFNINGIRARPHQLAALYEQGVDIIGLQETKCHDDQFPAQDILDAGYHVIYHGQKGHYGVALLSKQAPVASFKGYETDTETSQRRLVGATWTLGSGKKLHVLNGYFPQGENRDHPEKFPAKRKFYEDLQSLLENRFDPNDYLMVMGDFNIAPTDGDIGIGPQNAKRWLRTGTCSFLPEEREWFSRLTAWGLTDCFRHAHPEVEDRFSWFDYRSRGFEREPKRGLRIDHLMVTPPLLNALMATDVDYDLRSMTKPSDHAPVWADFDLA